MEPLKMAQDLFDARISASPIQRPSITLDLKSAALILQEGIELRLKKGEEITGITLEGQNHFSYLTNQMNLVADTLFSLDDCIHPSVSPHLVYYIDSHLEEEKNILNAISSIGVAVLIRDPRFEKSDKISIEERIADNFFTSYYILGKKRLDLSEVKDRPIRMGLNCNSQKKAEIEISSLSFGIPFLGKLLKEKSLKLNPGTVVLTPNLFDEIPLNPNMDITLFADYFGALKFRVI